MNKTYSVKAWIGTVKSIKYTQFIQLCNVSKSNSSFSTPVVSFNLFIKSFGLKSFHMKPRYCGCCWLNGQLLCLCCRTLQPVPALRPDGVDSIPPAGLQSAAHLLLLTCADVHRRLVLQAADQERRLQQSRRMWDPGVCRGRGVQLHHGNK